MALISPELNFHALKKESRDQSPLITKSWKWMWMVHAWAQNHIQEQLKLPARRTCCESLQGKQITIVKQSQAGLVLISVAVDGMNLVKRVKGDHEVERQDLNYNSGTQIVRLSCMSRVANKTSLVAFIVCEWRKAQYREKLQKKCYRITRQGSGEVPDLQCHQEEADSHLLLHASHAAREGYQAIVICSEVTDVFIMSLAFQDLTIVPEKNRKRIGKLLPP